MHENLGEKGGLPISAFPSREAWAVWLDAHHADSQGVWLAIPRKGGGEAGVSYADALEVALCYGWIDGQKGKLDERSWLQRFTPRRPGSVWSRVNRDKALVLIARDEMRPAGLREVERAQADGRWDAAYEPWAVEGDRAVAIGWSRYEATGDKPPQLYHNAYLLEFAPDGRCRSFHEFYMLKED